MIIALPPGHDCTEQLAQLAGEVRATIRGDAPRGATCLRRALNLTEAVHGSRSATYTILPGSASDAETIEAYQYIRRHYRDVLTLLYMAPSDRAPEITIGVGTLSRRDEVYHSSHDLMAIMPRILAHFRGALPPR